MRYAEDINLKKKYKVVLEDDELSDDDFLAGVDESEKQLYILGYAPNYKVPDNIKTQTYKVDISSVKPGSLSQQALLKAFNTIRLHTPPTWQYAIQREINLPITLKVGRNTIFKDACPYTFDYEFIKDKPVILGSLKNDVDYLVSTFDFKPEKVYVYLRYIPLGNDVRWDQWQNYNPEISGLYLPREGAYDTVVTGTVDGKPAAIGKHIRQQRQEIVYGPIKSIDFRDLTMNGIIVRELDKLVNASKGVVARQYENLYRLANTGALRKIPQNVKRKCDAKIYTNAKSVGLLESYEEQLTEQHQGHWQITANVPGKGKTTSNIAGSSESNKRHLLGIFASKYMRRSDIGWWVDENENKAIIKWIPAKPSGKVLSSDNYIEWPAMYRPKQ